MGLFYFMAILKFFTTEIKGQHIEVSCAFNQIIIETFMHNRSKSSIYFDIETAEEFKSELYQCIEKAKKNYFIFKQQQNEE